MNNLIVFGLLVILLVVAQFASAKTVDEVIEKYIQTRGGQERLGTVRSIYMEGTRETMGTEETIKIITEQDKLSRIETDNGLFKNLVVITDKNAWAFFHPGSMVADQMDNEQAAGLRTEMDIAGPLVNYVEKGYRADLIGKELAEGNNCYKIRLTTGAGREMMFWIDTVTWLLNQASGVSVAGIGNETVSLYRNYQEVDGIKFAHICETKSKGPNENGSAGVIFFHQIVLNPVVDPKMFFPQL